MRNKIFLFENDSLQEHNRKIITRHVNPEKF